MTYKLEDIEWDEHVEAFFAGLLVGQITAGNWPSDFNFEESNQLANKIFRQHAAGEMLEGDEFEKFKALIRRAYPLTYEEFRRLQEEDLNTTCSIPNQTDKT